MVTDWKRNDPRCGWFLAVWTLGDRNVSWIRRVLRHAMEGLCHLATRRRVQVRSEHRVRATRPQVRTTLPRLRRIRRHLQATALRVQATLRRLHPIHLRHRRILRRHPATVRRVLAIRRRHHRILRLRLLIHRLRLRTVRQVRAMEEADTVLRVQGILRRRRRTLRQVPRTVRRHRNTVRAVHSTLLRRRSTHRVLHVRMRRRRIRRRRRNTARRPLYTPQAAHSTLPVPRSTPLRETRPLLCTLPLRRNTAPVRRSTVPARRITPHRHRTLLTMIRRTSARAPESPEGPVPKLCLSVVVQSRSMYCSLS
ncbi:unnamed protein product [Heligmosomoides polygyrus]|uniref:Basic proline-rich protein n=1 Tax=Heligmosomoides polygyrus TaxID=6339 RepID=A0A183FF64_HELPZ|nr:unnamed protein product [Heligmosomoides polygyrus]